MAAPSPSARPTSPTGFKMPDGYQSLFAFKNASGIQLWMQTNKFGGYDGGDKIPTSTMFNIAWRTFAARKLKTKDDSTSKCAFDPDVFNPTGTGGGIVVTINDDSETITEFFPDGSTLAYWGFLNKFMNPEFKEGDFPTADVTIVCTNWDKLNQVEAGPIFTPASGT